MQKDLTLGSPMKVILMFTFPIFIGNVFQQFYNMADTVIVGQFVGNHALAAVGSTGTIMFLIYGLVSGMSVGFTVPVAQYFGAGNIEKMRKSVGSAVILSTLITSIMTFLFMCGMHPLLQIMQTPADIYQDAYAYIIVICIGIFAQVFYNLFSSILRALGNSKVPLYFLILAAFLNIFLDLVFIIYFKMGVSGAAWATVISQGLSALLCLVYMMKKVELLHLKKEDWKIEKKIAVMQLKVGIPMALQYSITAIGTTMLQTSLNLLGSTAVAGFTAATKIEQVVTQAYVAMGVTMATYCAQNSGAKKYGRVQEGFRAATKIGILYSIVFGMLVAFVGKYMTYWFVSEDVNSVIYYVDMYLKCAATFFVPLTVVNLYRNGIQGMGFGFLPMMAGVAELLGRGIASYVSAISQSYFMICMGGPIAWVFAASLLLWAYYRIMKQVQTGWMG